MRRHLAITVILILLPAVRSLAAEPAPKLEVKPDRPDAMYHVGEKVTFSILLRDGNSPLEGKELTYKLSKDGFTPLASGTITSAAGVVTVKQSLDEPGVIHCDVTYAAPTTRPVIATAGAAFDPEKIKASLPPPDDFDAFWEKERRRLADEPAHPVLTPVESHDANVDAFDVQINCPGGAPESAYLAIPKGAKPKSLGAILYPHSAGVRSSDLPHAVRGAKLGLMALDINAHGIVNGKPDKFYLDLYNNELRGYSARGADDLEKVYFKGMFLRLLRALDYLTDRPEWDGKVLIVEGSSQGGGQALVAAGLDHRVTLCLAAVPALCDHTGFIANRASGWPRIVPKDAGGKYNEKVTQVARCIDAMNFAMRIQCPTWVTVGLIDKTCAATSVYAGYNAIPAGVEKHILPQPAMGHAFPADLIAKYDDIIRQHLAQKR